MNMHEWMMQPGAPQRPDRPQFDGQAYRALAAGDPRQQYMSDFRGQIGDWRDQMHDYRDARRDYRQDGRAQMNPVMNPGGGNGPIPGIPAPGPNTQFPLNPQPIPGSGYGFNLADILQRFPNGLGRGMNGLPGLNPGY